MILLAHPIDIIGLIALGFGVGAYGTLIGAGGGFVLMPILLLLYPHDSPELLTSISLATGVLLGAQVGAHLSNRFKGVWLIRSLALALGLVAIRILYEAL